MSRSQVVYSIVLGACGIAAAVQDPANWVGWFVLSLAGVALFWHKVTA